MPILDDPATMPRVRAQARAGAFALVLSLLFAGASAQQPEPPTAARSLQPPRPVVPAAAPPVAPAEPATLGCVVDPARSAEIAAAVPGVLETVLVDRGARVRRGQLVATLQADVERASVDAAWARASAESDAAALAAARDLARLKLRRIQALSTLDVGGRLELENAAAEFEIADHRLQSAREALVVARSEHALAERQLGQREIRSPIDGVVADRLLNPGERVDGRPILRVLDVDRLRAEVVVPAARFGSIREGMTATLRAEAPDGAPVTVKVSQVDRYVDAASGTFRARLDVPPGRRSPPAGVRCRVAFDAVPARPQ